MGVLWAGSAVALVYALVVCCMSDQAVKAPPYPVFPKYFVGEINVSDPRDPSTATRWQLAVRGSEAGRRQVSSTLYFGGYSYRYLIFDRAPNPRPGSRSANNTVVIAEDGNLPPEFYDNETKPSDCFYGTYTYPGWVLPVGLTQMIFSSSLESCEFHGGACVPSDLKYSGVVTLDDGRRVHQWNKTSGRMFTAYYFFYTDLNTNLPVASRAWMFSTGHTFPMSFDTLCSFDLHPGNPPDSSFNIRERNLWTEKCKDGDLGPPGGESFINPDRIFASNSTTDDCFQLVLGDEPFGEAHVSFSVSNGVYHTPNCTAEDPCVAIRPSSLVFTQENWSPQVVCLHFLRSGVSAFGFQITGGGYNYSTAHDRQYPFEVYTCEHGNSGPDGCNI